jgi:hypothetical protein
VCCNESEIRKGLRILFGIIPGFLDMMTLVGIWLLFSSWLMYLLFEDSLQVSHVDMPPTYVVEQGPLLCALASGSPRETEPASFGDRIHKVIISKFIKCPNLLGG